jgi:RelA/SpoT family (p)ppGpp synthetase
MEDTPGSPSALPERPEATGARLGFARRAKDVLLKAKSAVLRQDPAPGSTPAPAQVVVSFSELTERLKHYMSAADIAKVREAFRVSDEAHLGQFRKSGEPYITHPVAVAKILAQWRLDVAAIQAALLHDVIEDTRISKQDLARQFGPAVAELVDGVSKLDRLNFASSAQAQAESFRKMLLAMARDVRVILIKIADRLHNIRTLGAMERGKQRRIARETLDIYSPIAHRLGLNEIYRELQEACFELLYPLRHAVLKKALLASRGNRREVLRRVHDALVHALEKNKLKAEVFGREKTLYGIYRKMVDKHLSFAGIHDIYGFRVVVHSVPECYLALGVLHGLYKPIPGKFKDYIAIPKFNGYQSLHTTLVGPFGQPVEFQIRTDDMNRIAESGVAAHWMYKEDETTISEIQSRTHQWLQSLIEIQQQTGDSAEFLENIKVDLFPHTVYVFTPKGKILSLPRGATPVDMAYSIHSDIGNRCVGAQINGVPQALNTELRNGDVVQIETQADARPNPAWLASVRSGRARAEIRHYLRTVTRDESIALGERLLQQAAETMSFPLDDATPDSWNRLLKEAQAKDRDELLSDIGLGRRLPVVLARQLWRIQTHRPANGGAERGIPEQHTVSSADVHPVLIRGTEGMAMQMANCCTPIPGDRVTGQLRRDLGLVVHQTDCVHAVRARRADPDRWLDLQWAAQPEGVFSVNVDVRAQNQRGVLGYVASAVAEADSNIVSVTIRDEDASEVTIHFKLQVRDRVHLARVMRAMKRIRHVLRVSRIRAGTRDQAPSPLS